MMKTLWVILVILGSFLFCGTVWAVESVTQTLYVYSPLATEGTATYSETDTTPAADIGEVRAIKIAFKCAADGTLTAEDLAWRIDGFILKVVVIPGSTQPDGSYNVVLKDDTGTSVVGTVLDGLDGSVTYTRIPQVNVGGSYTSVYGPAMAVGDIEFDITDNGTADSDGNVWVFFVK